MEIYEIEKGNLFEVIIYIRTINSKYSSVSKFINNLLYGIGYFTGYWIVKMETGKPDVIHANIIVPVSRVALFLHRFTGIPYIISEHWTIYLAENRDTVPDYSKSTEKAFALVPVTENLKQALISRGYNNRYFVVPNVVDTNVFTPDLSGATTEKKRLLHVSSMKDEHKNISGIIRSIARLAETRNDFNFTFVGDATTEQKELVKSSKIEHCVEFAGEIEHKRVASVMRNSDALVMFSNVENLPCVILEAFSCGLPVISTNVGGIAEVLKTDRGLLIDKGDETSLTGAMNHMLDNLHRYDKQKLHTYAVENFSIPVIAGKFHEIYSFASNKSEK